MVPFVLMSGNCAPVGPFYYETQFLHNHKKSTGDGFTSSSTSDLVDHAYIDLIGCGDTSWFHLFYLDCCLSCCLKEKYRSE